MLKSLLVGVVWAIMPAARPAVFASTFSAISMALASATYASSVTFECDFPRFSDKEGSFAVREKFSMKFALDTVTADAFMIGNNGVTKVFAVVGAQAVTFLERLDTGAVQTTTIISDNGEAVHSRNSIIVDKLIPSQYYGNCNRQ